MAEKQLLSLDEIVQVPLTRREAAACLIAVNMVEGYNGKLEQLLEPVIEKLQEHGAPVGVFSRVLSELSQ